MAPPSSEWTVDNDVIYTPLRGQSLLDCPMLNKGTAFNCVEREELGLLGLLPPHEATLEEQLNRIYETYQMCGTDLERHVCLRDLQDRNEVLFYRLVKEHLKDMMPIIYTPTVGAACQRFSHLFRHNRGLYVSYPERHRIDAILDNRPHPDVDVIVVTDGERILGLGDQGAGGMGIPIGKLSLYTLCGGIHPGRTLPILLDVGTDNPERLSDPLYLGWRHGRIRGKEYDEFIEIFVQAVKRKLPNVLLQWEDFAHAQARRILDRYHDELCTFNDDIQGTAAVTLAALLSAAKRNGQKLSEQRIVFVGAGSAATGICELLVDQMVSEGLDAAEARRRLWLMDSQGLVHAGRSDLQATKIGWARCASEVGGWVPAGNGHFDLMETVRRIKPTVLIGASGKGGMFDEALVREMAKHVKSPIIFALSNPTTCCEARPADLIDWTEGRALVATGSPFADVTFGGQNFTIAQCNNCLIFPGVGLGAIACSARRITETMLLSAGRALAELAPTAAGTPLLPGLERIGEVSRHIAQTVAMQAMSEGHAETITPRELRERIEEVWWEPHYLRVRPCQRTATPCREKAAAASL